MRPACRGSSRWATCGAGRSSVWPRPSGRVRSSSRNCTSSSPRWTRDDVSAGGSAGASGSAGLAAALAAPLAGLVLLLARPSIDHTWEHHPSHFWLVLGSAAVAAVLAYATGAAAAHPGGARGVFLLVAMLAPAGFLGLHPPAAP